MPITGQSGEGVIVLFDDFCGPEIPIANAKAYGASAGGCAQYLGGPFKITGSVVDTDCGAIAQGKASGYLRLSASGTTDADGIAIGTEVCFSPTLNGTLTLECRLENYSLLTLRNLFIGFAGANADEVAEPLTSTTTTLTYVTPVVGFHLDSTLTAATYWHMPYMLAAGTQTSTDVVSTQVAVAGESDILRVDVFHDGGACWYINGKLEQTVASALAATPATLLAGMAGIWAKSTAGSIDLDYLLIKANRDWTR